MLNRKPKVLLSGESTFLTSGYATYGHEVMKRLHEMDLFELCELGSFGPYNDPRQYGIPWKYIPVCPNPQNSDEKEEYEKKTENKFGMWKFEKSCLEFQPDIIFSFRDPWMAAHEFSSPFRKYFHHVHMPTCDGIPQNEQWIDWYKNADAIFTYSDWALEVLNQQGNGYINTICSAPPGADIEVFKPVENKEQLKVSLGLPKDSLIIGTVMRNMKRKLYPDLIEAFGGFLKCCHKDDAKNAYLYLHTAYPDVGWDIPRLITESGLGHRIFVTYKCQACGECYPSFYHGAKIMCKVCGKFAAGMPGASDGVTREILAKIMNLFDCYVQYSVCEGAGMPPVEAASCGVPVFETDYSAMSDYVRKLSGYPIKVQRFFREAETYRLLALPDNDDFICKLVQFFDLPIQIRKQKGIQAREGVLKYFTYDRTAKIWADHFMSIDLKDINSTWNSPAKIHKPNTNIPNGLNNEEWVRWCFSNVLGEPDKSHSYSAMRMLRELNEGISGGGMGGFIWNDATAIGLETNAKLTKFTREVALKQMIGTVNYKNYWEKEREKRCIKK